MPLYSFKCQSCGHIQDAYFTLNESHLINCESCKSTNMKQYFGNANVSVHGFTEFVDPRGGSDRLTMAQIRNIEKKKTAFIYPMPNMTVKLRKTKNIVKLCREKRIVTLLKKLQKN